MIARCLTSVALLACLFLGGCIQVQPFGAQRLEEVIVEKSDRALEWNKIAIVDVGGFIAGEEWPLFFTGTTTAEVKEKLRRAAESPRVAAVVLRINSPGGEVTASDLICQEVLRFKRETGKPVVAMLMGTAASGGYYVACAADEIVAAPSCVTGSVGVVMELANIEELFEKIGVETQAIKSGPMKDIGSPTRRMTSAERDVLQEVNRSMFERFAQIVRARRPGVTDADWETIKDGRILTADQALALHLVDKVGYPEDAFAAARKRAEIGGATVVLYRHRPHYTSNIYSSRAGDPSALGQALDLLLLRHGAAFLYLWQPGV